jgi:hypothetical protein
MDHKSQVLLKIFWYELRITHDVVFSNGILALVFAVLNRCVIACARLWYSASFYDVSCIALGHLFANATHDFLAEVTDSTITLNRLLFEQIGQLFAEQSVSFQVVENSGLHRRSVCWKYYNKHNSES